MLFRPALARAATAIRMGLMGGILALFGASGAFAGPYDGFNSRPGDRIVNTATTDYFHNGRPMLPLTDSAAFVVRHFALSGTMEAFERYRGVGDPVSLNIPQGLWSPSGNLNGPFSNMGQPEDTSELTMGENYVVPGPLRVRATTIVRQGVPVIFAITEPALNINGATIDSVPVTLVDSTTGDTEVVLFFETEPDSGIFVGWVDTSGRPGASGDGWLRTAQDSRITATYRDPGDSSLTLSVSVLVTPPAPEGRVFDSASGELLDGVTLTLVDASTGAPASVVSEDLRARFPSTIQTGQAVQDSLGRTITPPPGGFVFPYVAPGTYRIVLGENGTHTGPSLVADADLATTPGGPWRVEDGSRLDAFDVNAQTPARFDIPLDRVIGRPDVVRTGSLSRGAVGDVFEYLVEITPQSNAPITFRDELPLGIRFIPGTFLIDGEPWTPEVSTDGRTLTFRDVPVRGAGYAIELTYGARIAAEADLQSWTRFLAGGATLSDDHDIVLEDAFGLQEIAILGEVLAGPCGAPIEDRNLEGIRVLLETGDYVLTDSRGLFSFRDITRRPHVVQIDTNTLPPGAELVLCQSNTRAAGSAISRFVDVAPGQMARVDFRVVFDEAAVAAADATRARVEATVTRTTPFDVYTDAWFAENAPSTPTVLSPSAEHPPLSESLEIVFVRGANERVRLTMDGAEVRPSVQQSPVASANGTMMLERWSGVRVREGRSMLTFVFEDSHSGQELRRETREVAFATRPGRLTLEAEGSALQADGSARPMVRLRVTDRNGTPVRAGTRAQFTIDDPFYFVSRPQRDSAPGFERRPVRSIDVEIGAGGLVELELAPLRSPGRVRISIATDRGNVAIDVPVRMDAKPWVFVGLAEGTLAADDVRANLRPLASESNPYAGRVAFFAEGVIKGRWLLTMRYDSAQERTGFYGIDPDKDYIVYGDRSIQGNDAQSRFPLYVRLRSDEAELLLGDFELDFDTMLIRDGRKATGLRGLYETDKVKVMAFVAETDQRHARDRIPLNGTVGPYVLTQGDAVPHSESVSLVTVSRLDATRELASLPLQAGRDYVLDHATGRLWLRNPTPAFNANMDRHVLVVDYETDSGSIPTRIAGVRVEGDVSPRVRVGATAIHARGVDGQNVQVAIAGLDITYTIGPDTLLRAEAVSTRKTFADGTDRNHAAEIRFEHSTDIAELYARYRVQRGDVELTANRSQDEVTIAQIGASRRISGPDDKPGEGVFVEGSIAWERNATKGTERTTAEALRLTRDPRGIWGGGLSWSKTRESDGSTSEDLAALARAGWTSLDGRMRQDLELRGILWSEGDDVRSTLTFGAEYDLTESVAMFARFEGNERPDGTNGATSFSMGIKARPWTDFEGIFALSQASSAGNQGLGVYASVTQDVQLNDTARLSFGMDVQRDFGAADVPMGADIGNPYIAEDFVAGRVGYRKETETWAFGVDAEGRSGDETGDTANLRIRADGELGNGWSVGGEAFAGWSNQNGETRRDIDVRFAAAQRRVGREPITLFQAEINRDETSNPSTVVFLSAQHNRHLGEKGELGLRYALRHVNTELSSGTYSSLTHFAGAEYRHDLGERFDIGLQGSVMHDAGSGVTAESYGLSLGMTPFDNGWLSVGYNFQGFEDDHFSAGGATQKGPFVQFRIKIDQDTVRSMFRN